MITAYPNQALHPVVENFAGNLATVGVTIKQGTTTVVARVAADGEVSLGSGIYVASIQAPALTGDFVVLWDDGAGNYASEELQIVRPPGETVVGASVGTREFELVQGQAIDLAFAQPEGIDWGLTLASAITFTAKAITTTDRFVKSGSVDLDPNVFALVDLLPIETGGFDPVVYNYAVDADDELIFTGRMAVRPHP